MACRWNLCFAPARHLCVATMTAVVACGAGCPDGRNNKSRSPVSLRGPPPRAPRFSPRHLPFVLQRSGQLRVELFTSQLSVWKRLQMLLCFSFSLFISDSSLRCQDVCWVSVFKALEEKGNEKSPELFLSSGFPAGQKYKVNSSS